MRHHQCKKKTHWNYLKRLILTCLKLKIQACKRFYNSMTTVVTYYSTARSKLLARGQALRCAYILPPTSAVIHHGILGDELLSCPCPWDRPLVIIGNSRTTFMVVAEFNVQQANFANCPAWLSACG